MRFPSLTDLLSAG